MKYYKLKESATGYTLFDKNTEYPADSVVSHTPVLSLVDKYPDDWEEVKDSGMETDPYLSEFIMHYAEEKRKKWKLSSDLSTPMDNNVNNLAEKILIRLLPSTKYWEDMDDLLEKVYNLAVKMNEERIKRGL